MYIGSVLKIKNIIFLNLYGLKNKYRLNRNI